MDRTIIYYYRNNDGNMPVKNFIESLLPQQQRKVTRVLSHIEEYGLVMAIPHIKKLTGTPLWEIRILGQDNVRVLYASVLVNSIVLLHGFIKKSQKTPIKEIDIAINRLREWENEF